MHAERRKCRTRTILAPAVVSVCVLLFLFNFSQNGAHSPFFGGKTKHFKHEPSILRSINKNNQAENAVEAGNLSYDQLRSRRVGPFNIDGTDVIVFLHIQKTAGTTFERYLVRQLNIPQPCVCKSGKKKCHCKRTNGRGFWLFSRFSTGWSCGLHADWTELVESGCVDEVLNRREHRENVKHKVSLKPVHRRYFFTTFLREPISRYLSEFRHMNRGATWSASKHLCLGRYPSRDELPPCFDVRVGWSGVTFNQFVSCGSNLANNRQTRMLADLSLVGCYNVSFYRSEQERNRKMLESAKANLMKMAFFGLQEDMRRSQYVFERMFGLQFNKVLLNWNETTDLSDFNQKQIDEVRRLNSLDLELYHFAKMLFEQRFNELKNDDPLFILNIAS